MPLFGYFERPFVQSFFVVNYMKNLNRLFLISFLVLMAQSGFGQFSFPKFDLSIGFGASAPVGAFAGDDLEGSLVQSVDHAGLVGVTKEDNGFAQLGFQYHARLSVKIFGVKLSMLGENAQHSPKRDELSDFLSDRLDLAYRYVQDDYERRALLFGIGKELSLFKLKTEISFIVGTSTLNFPAFSYEAVERNWSFTNYLVEMNDLDAFTYGLDIRVRYPIGSLFSIGGFMNYQIADYEYFYNFRFSPGGSTHLEFDDKVSYRKLDLGVFISLGL